MSFRTIKNRFIGLAAFGVLGSFFISSPLSAKAKPPASVTPPYASIVFGRSAWVGTTKCVPYPSSVNLGTAVSWLYSQGISATGGIVTGYTNETTQNCQAGYILYPSWSELAQLHSQYGFEAMSESATHTNWPQATTPAAINAESCNTLPIFQAHGFTNAWGMFFYPDNKFTPAQQSVVASCFAFGRVYGSKTNKQAAATTYPYPLKTLSVNGGNCNDSSLPCYKAAIAGSTGHYTLPTTISALLNPMNGQYSLVQFYRFVAGSNSTGSVTWDCTSSNPRDHWSNQAEVYCYNDFQTAIAGRGANITFTNPAAMAEAWGRVPAGASVGYSSAALSVQPNSLYINYQAYDTIRM